MIPRAPTQPEQMTQGRTASPASNYRLPPLLQAGDARRSVHTAAAMLHFSIWTTVDPMPHKDGMYAYRVEGDAHASRYYGTKALLAAGGLGSLHNTSNKIPIWKICLEPGIQGDCWGAFLHLWHMYSGQQFERQLRMTLSSAKSGFSHS